MTPVPILYVHHRSELGGAPTSLTFLIERLDPARFEPHVFCPEGPVAKIFAEAGATVHTGRVSAFTHIWASTYRRRRWALLVRELIRLPGHLRDLRRTLRARPFALVHLNDSPLIAAAWLARHAGIPVVWHLRSALPEREGTLRSNLLRGAIRRLAAASIAINDDVGGSFAVGSTVIPNAVDLDRFRPSDSGAAKDELGISRDRLVVSFFGFIYPLKGYREFINAASLLRASGVDALYLIVGGAVRGSEFFRTPTGRALERMGLAADYERDARELVKRLNLDDAITFLPFTTDTVRLYQASDVIVVPSRGPELSRPILEASACGRAVVASGSLSGAGLLLPGETGLIVPRRSPDALAAALAEVLRDPELRLRLGRNGRAHAERMFDSERNADRTVEVYERLLAGGP